MNSRFPVLSTIAALLKIFGWLLLIAGILVLFVTIVTSNSTSPSLGFEEILRVFSCAAVSLSGLLIVALSEIVGVLFAIEENTRRTAEAATRIRDVSQPY